MALLSAQNARAFFTTTLASTFQDLIEAPKFLRSYAKEKTYTTKTVQRKSRRSTEKVANDVIKGSEGNLNQARDYQLNEFEPPYYKEGINVSSLDIWDIPFESGTSIDTKQVSALAERTAFEMAESKKMIDRAMEIQAAQAMETGVVEVVNGDNIDYKRKAIMMPVLTGTDLWTDSANDKIKFFEDAIQLLRSEGKIAGDAYVDAIMGSEAFTALRKDEKIWNRDNFYMESIMDIQAAKRIGSGGVYHGTLKGIKGCNVRLWSYSEVYDNASGVSTSYLNPKIVHVVAQSFVAEISYCQVPELPQWIKSNPRAAGIFKGLAGVAKGFSVHEFVNERSEAYFAYLKASPLYQLVSTDKIYSAQVIGNSTQG